MLGPLAKERNAGGKPFVFSHSSQWQLGVELWESMASEARATWSLQGGKPGHLPGLGVSAWEGWEPQQAGQG